MPLAPRLALAEFLLENLRYGEAETVAAAAVQRCPTSAELRLVLARIQLQLLRLDDAEKTIEALLAIAPENAWAWFEYGKILQNSHHRSDSAFERAADLSGNDSGLLAGVAQHFLYDLDYEKAAKYYERLLNLHPGMWDNFVICRHYATCLQKIARVQEAAQIIANALESCWRAAERAKSEGLELIKREEALLLLQAGRADESFATLQSIQGIAAQVPRYDRVEYLPRTPERLQRLAAIVDSLDVFVLLQGPSFAMFAARLHEFAGFEFAIATLNSFPPIERELRRINRCADVLLFVAEAGAMVCCADAADMPVAARIAPTHTLRMRTLVMTFSSCPKRDYRVLSELPCCDCPSGFSTAPGGIKSEQYRRGW